MERDVDADQENPFASPAEFVGQTKQPMQGGDVAPVYFKQIKPLCIFMVIQGVLESAMGLLFVGLIFGVPMLVRMQQQAGNQIPNDQLQTAQLAIGAVYGVMGALTLAAGICRVVGGWKGLRYRAHWLGFASHFIGLLSLSTCYCLPSAVAVCIWGCIVFSTNDVKFAFQMVKDGHTAEDVEAYFYPRAKQG